LSPVGRNGEGMNGSTFLKHSPSFTRKTGNIIWVHLGINLSHCAHSQAGPLVKLAFQPIAPIQVVQLLPVSPLDCEPPEDRDCSCLHHCSICVVSSRPGCQHSTWLIPSALKILTGRKGGKEGKEINRSVGKCPR
jgi:hypothetical protein